MNITLQRLPTFKPRRLFALLACLAAIGPDASAGGAEVWEYSPYRVAVWVALDAGPADGEATEDAVAFIQLLTERLESLSGDSCRWTVGAPPASAAPHLQAGLDRVTADALPAGMATHLSGPESPDKAILLVVRHDRQGVRAEARQWDATVRQWGPVFTRRARQRVSRDTIAVAAAWAAFAPTARVDKVSLEAGRESAVVSVRGGALAPGGSPLVPVGAAMKIGQLKGSPAEPAGVSPLEWSWLWVESVDGAKATCQVLSIHRGRLPEVDNPPLLAWRVAATGAATRVRLLTPGDPPRPLAGFEVWRYSPGAAQARQVGASDENGFVDAPPDGGALSVLVIKSGSQAVASLPLVPGAQPELEATLSVDRDWLRAQSRLETLGDQLKELVARRQMEATRVRRRIADKQYDEAERLLSRLREATPLDRFGQTLVDEQKRIFSADRETQRAIEQLFLQTRQAAEQRLGPSLIDALAGELAEAQGIVATPTDEAPAEADPTATNPAATDTPAAESAPPPTDAAPADATPAPPTP